MTHFNIDHPKVNADNSVQLTSADVMIRFSFGVSSGWLKIRFPLYRSFDRIKEFLPLLIEYFKIKGLAGQAVVRLTKFNQLGYQLKTGNVADVMKHIFSPALLTYELSDGEWSVSEENLEGFSRWEKKHDIKDFDTDSSMTIVYGFAEGDQPQTGALTLKTSINFSADSLYDEAFSQRLDQFNSLLDSAFIWCMSPATIDLMRKGK